MWYKVDEKVPDKTMRYASTYGISILGINMDEPNPTPYDTLYMWKEGFIDVCMGYSKDSDFMPSDITHWMELPERPSA